MKCKYHTGVDGATAFVTARIRVGVPLGVSRRRQKSAPPTPPPPTNARGAPRGVLHESRLTRTTIALPIIQSAQPNHFAPIHRFVILVQF